MDSTFVSFAIVLKEKSFGLLLFPSLTTLLFVESNKHEDWVEKNPELIHVAQ